MKKAILIGILMLLLIGVVYADENTLTTEDEQDYLEGFRERIESVRVRIRTTSQEIKPIVKIPIQTFQPKISQAGETLVKEDVVQIIKEAEVSEPVFKRKFIIQTKCQPQFRYVLIKRFRETNFLVIEIENQNIPNMAGDDCVIKIGDESSVPNFVKYTIPILKEQVTERLKDLQLSETRGINNIEKVEEEVEEEAENLIEERIINVDLKLKSSYQYFVTPEKSKVREIAFGKSPENMYDYVSAIPWVSDAVMFGLAEKWILPVEFLESDKLENNPLGIRASDCSEHANTLVSLMRASGVPASDVRVVLGKVNFGGSVGGHAWVEYYYKEHWIALEPSSGTYYDEYQNRWIERNPLPFDYFALHEYPVVTIYYRYNDKYFENLRKGESDAPEEWSASASTLLGEEIEEQFTTEIQIEHILFLGFFVWLGYYLAKRRK